VLTETASSGMPTRRFSTAILAGAWPQTDPADCDALATIQQRKALDLLGNAEDIRTAATHVVATQSGHTVEAFHSTSGDLAATITGHADHYFAMARVSVEVGHMVQSLRTDLDDLDARAHQRIDQIARTATSRTAVAAQAQIIAVIATARGGAATKSAATATAIADQGSAIGIDPPAATPHPQGGSPTANLDDQIINPGSTGPRIQAVDNKTGPQQPGAPAPPASGPRPQIGPFPVPPGVAAAAPQGAPRPIDPAGGLLMPQNLPPASPPPNIPGVTPTPAEPSAPGPPALPSYGDLVKQVQQQGQQIADQAKAATRPTPGGIGGALLGGCTSTGLTAGIVGAETGPVDPLIAMGGCVVGGVAGVGSYLAGVWATNSIDGAG
jgi:hypothetical protein